MDRQTPEPSPPAVARPAPSLRLKDTHGQHLALQRLRADPAAGALQQLPQPLDSHAAEPLLNLEMGAPSADTGSPSPCSRNSPRCGCAGTLPGRTWPPRRNARLHHGTWMQWEERGLLSPNGGGAAKRSEGRRGRRKPPNVPPNDASPTHTPRACKTHAN